MNDFVALPVEKLRKAAPMRHAGYMEACLCRGQLSADGKVITFTRADYLELRRLFNPQTITTPNPPGCC